MTSREKIARIIDPDIWGTVDLYNSGPPYEPLPIDTIAEITRPSLTKADAILVKLSSETMPNAVARVVAQLRTDASDFMHYSGTSEIKTRTMCKVGRSEMALLLAWLEQHHPTTNSTPVSA